MDKNISNTYQHILSRKEAVRLACFYLQARLRNGSKTNIIFTHAVHIFNVAKIAEHIARHTLSSPHALDPDTAYVLGLIHDIGRIKDETETKVPHGLEGFDFLMKSGLKNMAPISLTHNFVAKQINADDFPVYSPKQIHKASKLLSGIEYNDYDRLIQLADNFSRGREILSLQERINKNKEFYHTTLSFEKDIFSLRDYFNNKYNINVENLVNDLFKDYNSNAKDIKIPVFSFSSPQTVKPLFVTDLRATAEK